jgi:glycosyltransferase involved in cell wall biosynthesis
MQKCDEAFEVLIGDDCSTDRTGEIADDYQLRYPNLIRVVRPIKNGGASLNMVRWIENANVEYLSICDGDEFWLRDDVLQKQVDIFKSSPDIGMLCAKAKCYIQEEGIYRGTLGYVGAEYLMTMLKDNRDVAAPTIAFRTDLMRQCIKDCTWYINQNFFYDSIMAYWFAYNSKIKFIDEELAAYRVLQNSACHATDNKKNRLFAKRYFMVKWHFVMTHSDLCNTEMFNLLMQDYDARTSEVEYQTMSEMRGTKAYKLGIALLKPLKKIFKC